MAETKNLRMNQVIAISNGEKSRKQKVLSKVYHELLQSTLFEGISKRYNPLDEEGERLPDEDKKVQLTVQQAVKEATEVLENMFNIVAMLDMGNCLAKANVIIDDIVLLQDIPATHLIFLEKQLVDIETFINTFPILDPAEDWEWSDKVACYASKPRASHRTKKVQDVLIKYAATKEFPAQTELITKDIITGYWTTIKFSGNMKKTDKDALLEKVRKLSKAVKIAREEANNNNVTTSDFGTKILNYIFGNN